MAYAFEKIMNQMDKDKANIFGDQQQQGGGGQQQAPQGTQGEVKTNIEGDISSGSGGTPRSYATPTQQNAGAQRAYEAAQKQPKAQGGMPAMSQTSANLTTADTKLQEEANKYVETGKADQNYSIPDADVEAAIGGDVDKRSKVATTISQTTPKPVKAWAPQTDYTVEDIENFKSTPGITGYLRSQYGPGYTAGQSVFDTGVIRSDPQFYETLRNLEGRQQDLTKKAAGYANQDTGVEATVAKAGKENLTTAQTAIKKFLTDQKAIIEGTQTKELEGFQGDVKAMNEDPAKRAVFVTEALKNPDIAKRIEEVKRERPDLAKYLTPEVMAAFGIDPTQFLKVTDPTGVTADSFYDDKEATRFNAIMGLLGQGGAAKVAGTRPGSVGSFGTEDYIKSILRGAEGKNTAADVEAMNKIQRIMEKLQATQGKYSTPVDPKIFANAAAGQVGREIEGNPNVDPNMIDINKFWKTAGSDNPLDFLSPEEAEILNAQYEELMDPTRVGAGRLYNVPNYSWDDAGYREALRQAVLAQKAGMPGPAPGPQQGPTRTRAQEDKETDPTKVLEEAERIYRETGGGTFIPQGVEFEKRRRQDLGTGIKDASKYVGR
jgi:hypothetical protein